MPNQVDLREVSQPSGLSPDKLALFTDSNNWLLTQVSGGNVISAAAQVTGSYPPAAIATGARVNGGGIQSGVWFGEPNTSAAGTGLANPSGFLCIRLANGDNVGVPFFRLA